MSTTTATKQPALDAEVSAAAPLVPVNGQQATALQAQPTPFRGCPGLATALAAAQRKCMHVDKTAHNKFHNYDYASAESVIEAAQQALAGTGLALLPLEQSLNGWERSGENRFELSRKFLLLHSSGESFALQVAWPVVPDKGRPLDKATAIAATLSLAYLLRDLLLMPRVQPEDDVNTRDDTKAKPQGTASKPTNKPANGTPKPMTGPELTVGVEKRDAYLAKKGIIQAGTMRDALDDFCAKNGYPDTPDEWSAEQVQLAKGYMGDWETLNDTKAAK